MNLSNRPFYTGYFAAVMATGIVSTALFIYRQYWPSDILMGIGMGLYVWLWFYYLHRTVHDPRKMWQDFINPATVFGFFTIVAGSNVLAVRFLLQHWVLAAKVLGTIGIVLWAVLFYTAMTILITGKAAREVDVNGGWLIAIVAEESIATYFAAIVELNPHQATVLFLISTTFWAMGLMLYIIFIGFIMNRLLFHSVSFGDLQPPYWINMGATAITVLASSRLLAIHTHVPILLTLRPFLAGVTLMLWAWGTWWIPLLLILGVWKYGYGREPILYHPSQWSIVFPLGMYATATTTMAQIHGFYPVHWLGQGFLWIGLGAWILVAFLALFRNRQT
ncbi:MAG: C4-dicarboxylate ABC transporter [Sulfobacillus acidophilus]|uniref:C4-dicarboxylate ABC transporter n=1 Tax=Sulfobacillus acidophilus TaxID=53633 RepID=A0A2T2WIA5_9FIRM|nr:MAG: C4-dicarboxylate ABC transporter [Sulfobacillus acidophilus]